MDQGRRKYPRYRLRVKVRVSGPFGAAYGELRNMSLGGAAVFLKHAVGDVNDTVELLLPHTGEGELPLAGKIVRIDEKEGERVFAIRFYRAVNAAMYEKQRALKTDDPDAGPDDRRSHDRVAARVVVTYRTNDELRTIIENISMGGFAMTVDRAVNPHEEVSVEIPHPVTGKVLPLTGRAVHITPVTARGETRYRVGFEFKYLTAEERGELSRLLCEACGKPSG